MSQVATTPNQLEKIIDEKIGNIDHLRAMAEAAYAHRKVDAMPVIMQFFSHCAPGPMSLY